MKTLIAAVGIIGLLSTLNAAHAVATKKIEYKIAANTLVVSQSATATGTGTEVGAQFSFFGSGTATLSAVFGQPEVRTGVVGFSLNTDAIIASKPTAVRMLLNAQLGACVQLANQLAASANPAKSLYLMILADASTKFNLPVGSPGDANFVKLIANAELYPIYGVTCSVQ